MADLKSQKQFSLTPKPTTAWLLAIDAWMRGDDSKVRRCLTQGKTIPKFAREWLADALEGKIRRKRGRKQPLRAAEGLAEIYRRIKIIQDFDWVLKIERAKDTVDNNKHGRIDDSPKNRALATVAERFDLSEDAVSRIVYPRGARNSAK